MPRDTTEHCLITHDMANSGSWSAWAYEMSRPRFANALHILWSSKGDIQTLLATHGAKFTDEEREEMMQYFDLMKEDFMKYGYEVYAAADNKKRDQRSEPRCDSYKLLDRYYNMPEVVRASYGVLDIDRT